MAREAMVWILLMVRNIQKTYYALCADDRCIRHMKVCIHAFMLFEARTKLDVIEPAIDEEPKT